MGGTRGGDGGRAVKAAMEAVKRRSWRLEAIATLDSRAADDQFRPLIQVVVCVSDEVVSVIPAGKTPS